MSELGFNVPPTTRSNGDGLLLSNYLAVDKSGDVQRLP